ncbi:hypothetical protein U0035_03370 [Niabella yanshanensis]|uniref:tRNA_anti-like n=1 Tax=Niabella yanshanensis TaxID=577386 RepID=A0ABZ0W7D0_9BACT|nr:hypothetical protein [Niabella yanshanensis]WQD39188.1 hypothetical protein U0035_03370 [Niabella yanshanensis]
MKRKTAWALLLLVVITAAGLALYYYYKKPPDIRKAAAHYETTAPALLADFNQDESTANAKYLDKVVVVEGTISHIELNGESPAVFLETGDPMAAVTCSFYNTENAALKPLKTGTRIKIKGVCTGMLTDVVLNKCSIVE